MLDGNFDPQALARAVNFSPYSKHFFWDACIIWPLEIPPPALLELVKNNVADSRRQCAAFWTRIILSEP